MVHYACQFNFVFNLIFIMTIIFIDIFVLELVGFSFFFPFWLLFSSFFWGGGI